MLPKVCIPTPCDASCIMSQAVQIFKQAHAHLSKLDQFCSSTSSNVVLFFGPAASNAATAAATCHCQEEHNRKADARGSEHAAKLARLAMCVSMVRILPAIELGIDAVTPVQVAHNLVLPPTPLHERAATLLMIHAAVWYLNHISACGTFPARWPLFLGKLHETGTSEPLLVEEARIDLVVCLP
mmetsp:Transcript_20560/g.33933  ORF Transcript_20560/g.33933 Transcript_20560/m.33933 type:complete len:184 (-) Transcript_20560:188-739(-)